MRRPSCLPWLTLRFEELHESMSYWLLLTFVSHEELENYFFTYTVVKHVFFFLCTSPWTAWSKKEDILVLSLSHCLYGRFFGHWDVITVVTLVYNVHLFKASLSVCVRVLSFHAMTITGYSSRWRKLHTGRHSISFVFTQCRFIVRCYLLDCIFHAASEVVLMLLKNYYLKEGTTIVILFPLLLLSMTFCEVLKNPKTSKQDTEWFPVIDSRHAVNNTTFLGIRYAVVVLFFGLCDAH